MVDKFRRSPVLGITDIKANPQMGYTGLRPFIHSLFIRS
jgi:hypothetical protein